MKRKDFFKVMAGLVATSLSPLSLYANSEKKIYSHDEIFKVWEKNDRLVYFKKDSPVYKYLVKQMSGRIVESKRFSHYSPQRSFILLKKDQYTMDDFTPLVALLNSRYEKYRLYANWGEGDTFLRMIHEKENNTYYPDLFEAWELI